MISRPKLFAILGLPAGAVGYLVTSSVLSGLDLADGARNLLLMLVPLFVAGLCMLPFYIPLFDSMAKRDLAAIQARRAAETPSDPAVDRDNPTS